MLMQAWQPIDVDDPDRFGARFEGDPAVLVDAADLMLALADRPAWQADAACREHPEVTWFPRRGESTDAAKSVCSTCLVRSECRAYALEQGPTLHGVWAGTSERTRRQLRRTSTEVDTEAA